MLVGVPPTILEISGPATGLLDDPLALRARGAGPDAELAWRARHRDDEERVWRATAARAEDLPLRWATATPEPRVAALASGRPVRIDVRVEAPFATGIRTVNRRPAGEGVRQRRWRDGLTATLHLPAREAPCATLLVDATGAPVAATVAALAAPLLASRGALVLVVVASRSRRRVTSDPLDAARERLARLTGGGELVELRVRDPFGAEGEGLGLPPGVPGRALDPHAGRAGTPAGEGGGIRGHRADPGW